MEKLDLDKISLIVPDNDLESRTIINLAKNLKFPDIRISPQKWGASLKNEPPENLANLKENIWIVEIPGIEIETRLRYAGHRVVIFDHHQYPGLNRSNEQSSLEQFADTCRCDLTPEEKRIAINDKGYVWGLAEAEVPYTEVQKIRKMDYEIQGWTERDFSENLAEYQSIQNRIEDRVRSQKQVFLHETRLRNTGYLTELFHMPDADHYDWYRIHGGHRPYYRENLILLIQRDRCTVFFSGTVSMRNRLLWHCHWPGMICWMGGSGRHAFAGIEIPDENRFKKIRGIIHQNWGIT